ncbi:MAG: M55 family metallopeptidase [Sulfolobales archaeon]|nr:M55 family metallopeptidase [Sulfolobales archaeon]
MLYLARVYVSIDAEGLPGIFHPSQLTTEGKLFTELRDVMAKVVKVVVEELKKYGYSEVWVADSHGFMGNVQYLDVPDDTYLVRGSLRPTSMVYGIDRGFEAAMFIGYHSPAATPRGLAEHTYSGLAFYEVRVNGVRASEFYINALVAGRYGVPVALVAGDDKLREDVLEKAPWVVYVVFKESASRYSAVMKPMNVVLRELREGIAEAVRRVRDGTARPLKVDGPIAMEFHMRRSEYADAAEDVPGVTRVGAYTIRYVARDPVEGYKVMKLLATISSAIDYAYRV